MTVKPPYGHCWRGATPSIVSWKWRPLWLPMALQQLTDTGGRRHHDALRDGGSDTAAAGVPLRPSQATLPKPLNAVPQWQLRLQQRGSAQTTPFPPPGNSIAAMFC